MIHLYHRAMKLSQMFDPPATIAEDDLPVLGPIGVSFAIIGLGLVATTCGFFFGTHATRSQVGDWIGGVFGAAASLVGALLLYGAIRLQMIELRLQREELRLTRDEMKAAREVHEASKRELEEQTRIAKRAAVLDHIFAAAASMRSVDPQPHRSKPKRPNGQEVRVYEKPEPEFIAAQMHLGMLLKDPLIDDHERALLQEQFGLNIAYEHQPENITPSIAEVLEGEHNS